MDLTQLWAFLLPLTLSRAEASDTEKPSLDASLEIYKKLFEVKRKDQLNALKNLIELNDVNQQYKIIDIMLKGLFKVVHHYFDRNSNWNSLIRWGISFCNQTGIFDQGPHSQVLGLMAQELGISEKSPDYRNPFKTDHSEFFPSADTFQKALREEEKRRRKEEKRKEIRKGPRISRSQSEL
ncbi:coiled-coil domain-containing protein 134 isoform X3 [Ornithorhynchus anatinus]|uniref:coiled-coil domain-containing protein 134 isoform X3 n=1 Tax=Ornithorhynchus anatinus TaxID=9258 RepID=UPI0010A789B1|nr:coiled-coil domain-containing protein 134 isoform X3 [Ornithorhynchus anatinus]